MRVGEGGWSEAHQKERRFQHGKRLTRLMDAFAEGTTIDSEHQGDIKRAHRLWQGYKAVVGKRYVAAKKNLAANKVKTPKLDGHAIFVSKDVIPPNDSEFKDALRKLSLRRVHNRLEASVFLVNNVDQPGQRVHWAALLSGGLICSLRFILARGHAGQTLGIQPATNIKRYIWCSPDFIVDHPEVHRILEAKIPGTNFKWLASRAQCIELARKKATYKKYTDVIALVTADEQAHSEDVSITNLPNPSRQPRWGRGRYLRGQPNVFLAPQCQDLRGIRLRLTEADARVYLTTVDRTRSLGGFCGS
jgi:hypothetical protein